jgi:hypothetical protein
MTGGVNLSALFAAQPAVSTKAQAIYVSFLKNIIINLYSEAKAVTGLSPAAFLAGR